MASRTKGTTQKPKKILKEYSCQNCGDLKKETEYYVSYNPIHKMGRILYCKKCIKDMISDESGNVILDKVKSTLQLMDRPFLYNIWKTSLEEGNEVMGCYMKNIAMMQYRKLGWKESKILPEIEQELNYKQIEEQIYNVHFDVTNEMILKWGTKYEPDGYFKLEQFYNDMMRTNTIETTQDMVYLKKLAIISLKMDIELEEGNYDEAKKLGDLFSKYMADSKFRAMDKTDSDKTGGIRNFSSIYAEVESDGFIPPWEHYRKIRGISQDIVDKTIMHIENFTLKLNKVEKMTVPPLDTPQIEEDEIDTENTIIINDIEVDLDLDNVETETESDD